jgi:hypothetical protein
MTNYWCRGGVEDWGIGKTLSASSEFSFTGSGGIWLIMPGMFVILHQPDEQNSSQHTDKLGALLQQVIYLSFPNP